MGKYFRSPIGGLFLAVFFFTVSSFSLANNEAQSSATLSVKSSFKILGGSRLGSDLSGRTAISENYFLLKNSPGTLMVVATGYRPEANFFDETEEFYSAEERVSQGKMVLPVVRTERITREKWRLSKIRITYP